MRARRGVVAGWVLVGAYAVALVVATITTEDAALRPGDRADDGTAALSFIDAWERSRTATFVRTGTFERRSDVTGSVISSEDVLVQRPPQRLHRQLGGVDGRDDRRVLVCPSSPSSPSTPLGSVEADCTLAPPSGPTYDEDVASEVAALHSILTGEAPVYAVGLGSEIGCYDLVLLRVEPRAPFGREARFCFDEETGAPTTSRVAYEGGIVEVVAVTDVRGDVTEADLVP